ncbi:MAG: histidine phosphatase family protein [Pseudomonadota bacterium]
MTRLALLRHGHTEWNRARRIQGRSDIPLDDEARTDLARYELPDPWAKADIWSSPLKRAFETALLVSGQTPQTSDVLVEMNWGDWEGQRASELITDARKDYRHIEDWGWDYRPPNGESPAEVWTRLSPWVSGLRRDTVAVCHIGIMRVILARAWGWNFDCPAPFKVKRNRLYVVDIDPMSAEPEPVRLHQSGTSSCV